MLDRQLLRGPDYTGIQKFEKCVLGHNRLSIIDLSSRAHQPLSDEHTKTFISFNGEIFNFQELRRELEALEVNFASTSDTEVLLKSYIQWGDDFLKKIRGQFAFVIYDSRDDSYIIARDHFGIKPLFYVVEDNELLVSSCFRALIKEVGFSLDRNSVIEFLMTRFVLPPRTLHKNIMQVKPGYYLRVKNGVIKEIQYYKLPLNVSINNEKDAIDAVRAELHRSVLEQTISNVPIATFLSGGLDSSLVTALSKTKISELETFSIGFGKHSSEENHYSDLVSKLLGTNHNIYKIEQGLVPSLIQEMFFSLDHPSGSRDYLANMVLSKSVDEHSLPIKVVLTGTGADEIFNGYQNSYFRPLETSTSIHNLNDVVVKYIKSYGFTNQDTCQFLPLIIRSYKKNDINNIYDLYIEDFKNQIGDNVLDGNNFHNLFYMKTHLLGWELPTLDNTTSNYSLEGRVPLLDNLLVELAFSITGDLKSKYDQEKYILRNAVSDILPKEIVWRKKGPFSKQVMDYLVETNFSKNMLIADELTDLLNFNLIRNINTPEHFDFIWRFYMLSGWISLRSWE